MPDLEIKPEIGDCCYDCYKTAYLAMCKDNTLRTASFTHNGLITTITRKK